MSLNIEFDCSKILDGIGETIGPADESYYNSIKDKDPTWFRPLPEHIDRYNKIDAHSVFVVSLFFSSKNLLEEGNRVLASIAQYYSIYHLGYALVSLDFSVDDHELKKMKHSHLRHLLNNLEKKGIIPVYRLS